MQHIPVLQKEIEENFRYLDNLGENFLDCTLGLAGHAIAILKLCKDNRSLRIIGLDKDAAALTLASENIKKTGLEERFILFHTDFKKFNFTENNIRELDGALMDLGVSSLQFDLKERGFSFQDKEQPLDMRMDQSQFLNAREVLNTYSRSELIRILKDYGEEKFAVRIAENIVTDRKSGKIETVGQLLEIVEKSIPKSMQSKSGVHFGTRTFQALRIEVNEELIGLKEAIERIAKHLKIGARMAVITFHSLEDRIVKKAFQELANPCHCPKEIPVCVCGKKPVVKIITKKPLLPSEAEKRENPRSRSAKLRIIEII